MQSVEQLEGVWPEPEAPTNLILRYQLKGVRALLGFLLSSFIYFGLAGSIRYVT
jgi:hypothetical protein